MGKTLECGCCGRHFKGRQHWNWDKGFGRCLSCVLEILTASTVWQSEIEEYSAGAKEQWPEQWGE